MTELLKLELRSAKVINRLSRFTVLIEYGKKKLKAQIRNTGRLLDLIYPDSNVLIQFKRGGTTNALIVGVKVDTGVVLVDTYLQAKSFELACDLNKISWLAPYRIVRREIKVNGSRIDYELYAERLGKGYLELKSAAYFSGGYAMYPDSPTLRGRRHILLMKELAKSARSIITFIATHPLAVGFKPCESGDAFVARLLRDAKMHGVELRAVKICITNENIITLYDDNLPVYV
ncbi:MAG: DNA/RNA nuclease SfsA [Nitrososphaerota archaeon]|nr:DNA/RNA nuclease SfsA [Aigarchaeota archaeon]MDW8077075.1 DNA/RNA nuclease SfsA [Nitrososphaerota archaeon]